MNDNGAMIQEEVAAGMPAGFFSDPSGAGSDDSLLQSSRSNNGADAGSRSKNPVLSLSDLSEDENYEKLKAAAFGKKPLLDLRNPTRRNPTSVISGSGIATRSSKDIEGIGVVK